MSSTSLPMYSFSLVCCTSLLTAILTWLNQVIVWRVIFFLLPKATNRPRSLPMLRELMGWDWGINLIDYGFALQKRRMFLHQFLNRTAITVF
ncbi:hypothetical protein PILCRDRAFT_823687 [Piloderma croceum F 1598]|uniref:Uncharacterized protein n=1 Tax=Piloderma croceum (strain F 1598) TaxID=765440 RepID=A0A0C3AYP3_PILCF|nr:hypothetical protein PILCRDRAFT_823687 [Piloderma croceum F 1598]